MTSEVITEDAVLEGRAVDPYLLWALRTNFRGLRMATTQGRERKATVVAWQQGKSPWSARFQVKSVTRDDLHVLTALDFPVELSVPRVSSGNALTTQIKPLEVGAPVMAVIDFGFAFAHEQFQVAGGMTPSSRIASFWDQSFEAPVGDGWQNSNVPYGRELTSKAIDLLLMSCSHDGKVDEDLVYRMAAYRDVDRSLSHGTHVLDLAGGNKTSEPDAASGASLILVQLPKPTVLDTSGASMTAQVIDALDYLLKRVDKTTDLVINLSYAASSGPHSGATILERAMDDFITSRALARTSIVLPAGNGRLSNGHVQIVLTPELSERTVMWLVKPDDPTDSFVEVWYPRSIADGGLDISVCAPDGEVTGPAAADVIVRRGSSVGIVHRRVSLCDPEQGMALIALGPTLSDSSDAAGAGIWKVVFRWREPSAAGLTVDAWVQRDDASMGTPWRTRQSRFVSERSFDARIEDEAVDPVKRLGTGNGFAFGKNTTVVGGCFESGGLVNYTAAAGSGAARDHGAGTWPDVVAPSDASASLPGIRGAGTRGSARLRMNGTSVAAPQVARAIFNEYAG